MEKGIKGPEALKLLSQVFDSLRNKLEENPSLWKKFLNSLRGSLDTFRREWEKFITIFFKAGFEEGMAKIFNRIAKFLEENPQLAVALGNAFNKLADGIVFVIDKIQTLIDWWTSLNPAVQETIVTFLKVAIAVQVITTAIGVLTAALAFLQRSFLPLAAITALFMGYQYAKENWFGGSNEPPQQQAPTSYGAEDAMSTLNPSTTTNNTNNATTNNVTVYQTNSIESVASSEELHTALNDWSKKAQTSFPRTQ